MAILKYEKERGKEKIVGDAEDVLRVKREWYYFRLAAIVLGIVSGVVTTGTIFIRWYVATH